MTQRNTPKNSFAATEQGGATIFGLFLTMVLMVLGGLAIDTASGYREHARMQMVSDIVALSAAQEIPQLRNLTAGSQELSDKMALIRADAIKLAKANVSFEANGELLMPEDILFGYIDETFGRTDKAFINVTSADDPSTIGAVRVSLKRMEERGNRIDLNFLKLVGRDPLRVSVVSIVSGAETSTSCDDSVFMSHYKYMKFEEKGKSSYHFEGNQCFYSEDKFEFKEKDMAVTEGVRFVSAKPVKDWHEWKDVNFQDINGKKTSKQLKDVLAHQATVTTLNSPALAVKYWDDIWELTNPENLIASGSQLFFYDGPSVSSLFPPQLWENCGNILGVVYLEDKEFEFDDDNFDEFDFNCKIYRVTYKDKDDYGKFEFHFHQPRVFRNTVFLAPREVKIKAHNGGSVEFTNSIFVTKKYIKLDDSTATFGSKDACSKGFFDTYLISKKLEIEGNDDDIYELNGVYVTTFNKYDDVEGEFGEVYVKDKVNITYRGVYMEGEKLKLKGANTVLPCEKPLTGMFPVTRPEVEGTTKTGVAQLVK